MILTRAFIAKNLSQLQHWLNMRSKKKGAAKRDAFAGNPKREIPNILKNQPSALTRAARREILREAVFLW